MASLDNVHDRVRKLVKAGRIYYGQPTENMMRVLEDASSSWKATEFRFNPDNPDEEIRFSRPWGGEGPNENLDTLLEEARRIVYGCPFLTTEDVKAWESSFPGIVERAKKLIERAGRPEGSPYAYPVISVVKFLSMCESEGVEAELPVDSKHWSVVDYSLTCGSVRLSMEFDWLRRYCHATGQKNPEIRERDLVAIRCRAPRKGWKCVLVGMLVFDDVDSAIDFAESLDWKLKDVIARQKIASALTRGME